jgi:hypothetical protein
MDKTMNINTIMTKLVSYMYFPTVHPQPKGRVTLMSPLERGSQYLPKNKEVGKY